MKKFSKINEAKLFIADPSIVKRYAAFIMPLYITGRVKCDENLLDEYLELYKKSGHFKNSNVVCDMEILAIKSVLQENPMTQSGFEVLKKEIDNKCPKLEKFLRPYLIDSKTYLN